VLKAADAELDALTLVSYMFTTEKNGIKDEKVVQSLSGNALCCPVKATIMRYKYHQLSNAPTASYDRTSHYTAIKYKDIMVVICHAMTINYHHTGTSASEISVW
jgi:hypothetical protein